jgi:hypothetical protein
MREIQRLRSQAYGPAVPNGLVVGEVLVASIARTIVSLEMQIGIRLLLCLVSLGAFAATACAEEPAASPGENIDWPSPDEKFAFLTSYGEELHSIDLIDKKSGKKPQRIGEERFEPGLLAPALGARFESVRLDDKVGASDSRSGCLFSKR